MIIALPKDKHNDFITAQLLTRGAFTQEKTVLAPIRLVVTFFNGDFQYITRMPYDSKIDWRVAIAPQIKYFAPAPIGAIRPGNCSVIPDSNKTDPPDVFAKATISRSRRANPSLNSIRWTFAFRGDYIDVFSFIGYEYNLNDQKKQLIAAQYQRICGAKY